MAGEDAVSYTDMDIEKAINDFSNRFIDEISIWKTITYATKQLGFEKVIEHQRNCALDILQERDLFMVLIIVNLDLFLGRRLEQV